MTKTNLEIKEGISKILVKWGMPTRQVAINEIVALLQQRMDEIEERIADLLKTPHYNKDQTYDIAIKEVLNIIKSVDKNK